MPNEQFFSYIIARTCYLFDEMMKFALYQINAHNWILVLCHWNNRPRVDMLLHVDTLFWYWVHPSLFLLLSDACWSCWPIVLSLV